MAGEGGEGGGVEGGGRGRGRFHIKKIISHITFAELHVRRLTRL